MAILVTGGTGFLGSRLIRRLLKEDYKDIVILESFPNAANLGDVGDQVTQVHGDAFDAVDLFNVVTKYKVTDIFHLAVLLGKQVEGSPAAAIRANCLGMSNVFEVARLCGIRRVVWRSSGAVYGHYPNTWKKADEPLTMESLPKPDTIFGACQLFNERLAEIFADRHSVDHIVLRFSSVYGFGRGERRGTPKRVYSQLIEEPAAGKPFVAPPANQRFGWTYVEDAAEALLCAFRAKKPPVRIFNVIGQIRTTADAVSYIKSLLPGCQIEFGGEPAVRLPLVNTDPISKHLGFRPRFSMEEGIKDYLERLRAGVS